MYKTFKDLKSIKFPVYALSSREWYRQDGILFINGKVLDDTNMPGATLGIRRLQHGGNNLFRLKRAYTDFHSMIKSKKNVFIDSKGTPFIYTKTINAPLIYHMVKKLEYKDTSTVVYLRSVPYPISIPRPPFCDPIWAQVLYFKGSPWTIYNFSPFRGEDSYIRV